MRLQSGIPVVSIAVVITAVVSVAAVSIAEPHHVTRLYCWVTVAKTFAKAKIFAKAKLFVKSENDSASCDYGSATLLSDIVILCNFNLLMKRVSLGLKQKPLFSSENKRKFVWFSRK
jgi:hypothetical protein